MKKNIYGCGGTGGGKVGLSVKGRKGAISTTRQRANNYRYMMNL